MKTRKEFLTVAGKIAKYFDMPQVKNRIKNKESWKNKEGAICANEHDLEDKIDINDLSEYKDLEGIKILIRLSFRDYVKENGEKYLRNKIQELRYDNKNHSFLKDVSKLAPRKYKHLFESQYKGLPVDFVAPSIFLVFGKRNQNYILDKPITKIYGHTKIVISGNALSSEDGKVCTALLMIKQEKEVKIEDEMTSFRTSFSEIAKTMLKNRPFDKSTHSAIYNSLRRLDGCRIVLRNYKGRNALGGILSKAVQEVGGSELKVCFDNDFLSLIDEGYISIEPKKYFQLPPTHANLHAFLLRQKSFNTNGTYFGLWKLPEIYEIAGLGGLDSIKVPAIEKRRTIKNALYELQKNGIINSKFSVEIENDILKIVGFEESKEIKKM